MSDRTATHRGYRFPPEILTLRVWPYFRLSLSFRDVEDLLAELGVVFLYETMRQWCRTFGLAYAWRLGSLKGVWVRFGTWTKCSSRFADSSTTSGVDEDGDMIDILVQSRRNGRTVEGFFRKLLKHQGRRRYDWSPTN